MVSNFSYATDPWTEVHGFISSACGGQATRLKIHHASRHGASGTIYFSSRRLRASVANRFWFFARGCNKRGYGDRRRFGDKKFRGRQKNLSPYLLNLHIPLVTHFRARKVIFARFWVGGYYRNPVIFRRLKFHNFLAGRGLLKMTIYRIFLRN